MPKNAVSPVDLRQMDSEKANERLALLRLMALVTKDASLFGFTNAVSHLEAAERSIIETMLAGSAGEIPDEIYKEFEMLAAVKEKSTKKK